MRPAPTVTRNYLIYMSQVGDLIETCPIAPPTDAICVAIAPAVKRMIAIARANQGMRYKMRSWLPTEFGIEKPGQKLAAFATLTQDEFVKEVRQRRPKAADTLKPTALKERHVTAKTWSVRSFDT